MSICANLPSFDQLKDWQTLIAGLLAIVASLVALAGIIKQIRSTHEIEKKRRDEERRAVAAAICAELGVIEDHIMRHCDKMVTSTDSLSPRRIQEALPSEILIFEALAEKIGQLDHNASRAIALVYSQIFQINHSISILLEEAPCSEIAPTENVWPISALRKILRDARLANEEISKEFFEEPNKPTSQQSCGARTTPSQ